MNQIAIERTADFIMDIDEPLRQKLEGQSKKQLFENIYIAKQIDERKKGNPDFSLEKHIQGMVYAMMSSSIRWNRLEKAINEEGEIPALDEIFCNYDPDQLLSADPNKLSHEIQKHKWGSQRRGHQMRKLHVNIQKLQKFHDENGSVDAYYRQFIKKDPTFQSLIKNLSDSRSKDKLAEMGPALTAEYLRNVGYSIAKPDRHICRILGPNCLGCLERESDIYGAMEAIRKLALKCRIDIAKIDYILWSYCADGYGEICTENKPKCATCAAANFCVKAQQNQKE